MECFTRDGSWLETGLDDPVEALALEDAGGARSGDGRGRDVVGSTVDSALLEAGLYVPAGASARN